jgi:acetyltransferase-like isoleucine patch superfamily enzyme
MSEFFFKRFLKLLIREYIPNNIINHVPFNVVRLFYYKKALKHKIEGCVLILMGCYIYNSKIKMKIGKNVIINQNCILDPRGGLVIESNVNISRSCSIYTAGHKINDENFDDFTKSVKILDHAWIGPNSIIQPGVMIGRGAVVLPGSVVVNEVKDYEIVGGIPAKTIGKRNSNLVYNLKWDAMLL